MFASLNYRVSFPPLGEMIWWTFTEKESRAVHGASRRLFRILLIRERRSIVVVEVDYFRRLQGIAGMSAGRALGALDVMLLLPLEERCVRINIADSKMPYETARHITHQRRKDQRAGVVIQVAPEMFRL